MTSLPISSPSRHEAGALREFATGLLKRAGLPTERATDVAEILLEGDLLGHTTHGLALLPMYLREITEGRMPVVGEPRVVADHGAAMTWDGGYLPGPWLVRRAMAEARKRLASHALASVVIGRCHHIACLQSFLAPIAEAGLFGLLTCSDPASRLVAPPGAVERVYSPDPIAAAIPTDGEPMLIDISTSATAFGQVVQAAKSDRKLPGPWLVDQAGEATDDPAVLVPKKTGAMLPLGGVDLGYKGFGLALIIEALTAALSGHGRADRPEQWGSSVFLLLIDPDRFGGRAAFVRETGFLARACRSAVVAPGRPAVRLPGDGARMRRQDQIERGVALRPDILPALRPWAERFAMAEPPALDPETRASG